MNKNLIIFLTVIALLVIAISMFFIVEKTNKGSNDQTNKNTSIKYNSNTNRIYNEMSDDVNNIDEESNIVSDVTIQGIVEVKKDDSVYIFGGQHFGEYGYEMEEYTTAYIQIKDQTCIDYISSKEYKTDYIEEGDVLICTGDLTQNAYSYNMDTKDNTILVLKEKDYYKMQEEALNDNNVTITIGDLYLTNDNSDIEEGSHLYIKYNLEDYRESDKKYSLPFSQKVYITDNTKVIGDLKEGKRIKVEYNSEKPYISGNAYSGLELKSVEVIE